MVTRLYIDGEWADAAAGGTREVTNPADQSVLAIVADGYREDARRAIHAARRAFDEGEWPGTPATERGRFLSRVAAAIEDDLEGLADIETRDTGKSLGDSRVDMTDIAGCFRYYAELADKEAGRVVSAPSAGVASRVVKEPVGVCGQTSPWNYPLLQASWKIAPALAAGNTVVVKPAELTPMSTCALQGHACWPRPRSTMTSSSG